MKFLFAILATIMTCLPGCSKMTETGPTTSEQRAEQLEDDTKYISRRVACGKYREVCLCISSKGGMLLVPKEVCE